MRHRPITFARLAAVAGAVALGLLQAACTPAGTAVGAGATAGVAAAQERGLGGAIEDTRIRAQLNHLWLQEDEVLYRKVSLQIYGGRVLVTGIVPTEEMRRKAIKLAWQPEGVKEVINELRIGESPGAEAFARDTWISAQLKSELLFDSEISSINYSVETVDGVVFLMGAAQSQAELDRVVDHARNIAHVKKVVSYVEVLPAEDAAPADGQDADGGEAT